MKLLTKYILPVLLIQLLTGCGLGKKQTAFDQSSFDFLAFKKRHPGSHDRGEACQKPDSIS